MAAAGPDRAAPTPQFDHCGYQGISAGWADVYHRGLDCQWIDITGVPSGRYVLEVAINPAHVIQEHNYSNNDCDGRGRSPLTNGARTGNMTETQKTT